MSLYQSGVDTKAVKKWGGLKEPRFSWRLAYSRAGPDAIRILPPLSEVVTLHGAAFAANSTAYL
jgi:hypothetical protein